MDVTLATEAINRCTKAGETMKNKYIRYLKCSEEAGILAFWDEPAIIDQKLWENDDKKKKSDSVDSLSTVCSYMDAYLKVINKLTPVEKLQMVDILWDALPNEKFRKFLKDTKNLTETTKLDYFKITYVDFWAKRHQEDLNRQIQRKKDSQGTLTGKETENYMGKDQVVEEFSSELNHWYDKDLNRYQYMVAALVFKFGDMKFRLDYALSSYKVRKDDDPVVYDPVAHTFHIYKTNKKMVPHQKFTITDERVDGQLNKLMALRDKQGKRHLFVRKKKTGEDGEGTDWFSQGFIKTMKEVLGKDISARFWRKICAQGEDGSKNDHSKGVQHVYYEHEAPTPMEVDSNHEPTQIPE
ncbi:hypothetical protein HK097_001622 [Rhizophlyctis rosea]|uniref:Uncharacterized protein n=1 Tax=Rhizophlyctis rosea TaxID=64517 RepID=A0AAD5S6K0_9FUNG|nr:hypothetical protein HK097_001622 [Rhizophlyctis rosea]